MRSLVAPELFLEGGNSTEKVYVCLGGPGVGKTITKLAPAIHRCALQGLPCMLNSTLNRVRNSQLHILKHVFGEELFQSSVMCVGNHDLDDLAKSRTCQAITWTRMQSEVFVYEDMVAELQRALYDLRVALLL